MSDTIQDHPVRQFQEFVFSPTGMILIGGVILFYYFYQRKKLPDAFEQKALSDILKERLSGTLDIICDKESTFGTLRRGDQTLGKIKKYGYVKFETPQKLKTKKDDSDVIIDKLHLFEIQKTKGMFDFFLGLLRLNIVLMIVPSPFVKRYSLEYEKDHVDFFSLIEGIDLISFGKIYFYGWSAFTYIKGHAWLKGREDELEELINYPKRVVYLDTRHTKHMEDLDKLYALDSARRDSFMGSLMPKKNKKK